MVHWADQAEFYLSQSEDENKVDKSIKKSILKIHEEEKESAEESEYDVVEIELNDIEKYWDNGESYRKIEKFILPEKKQPIYKFEKIDRKNIRYNLSVDEAQRKEMEKIEEENLENRSPYLSRGYMI